MARPADPKETGPNGVRLDAWLAGWPKTVRCRLRLLPLVLLLFRRLLARDRARAFVCDSVLRRGGVWCGLGARSAAIYTPRETRPALLLSNPSAAPLRPRRPCRPVAARSPTTRAVPPAPHSHNGHAGRPVGGPVEIYDRSAPSRIQRTARYRTIYEIVLENVTCPITWPDNGRNTRRDGQCREIALICWFIFNFKLVLLVCSDQCRPTVCFGEKIDTVFIFDDTRQFRKKCHRWSILSCNVAVVCFFTWTRYEINVHRVLRNRFRRNLNIEISHRVYFTKLRTNWHRFYLKYFRNKDIFLVKTHYFV